MLGLAIVLLCLLLGFLALRHLPLPEGLDRLETFSLAAALGLAIQALAPLAAALPRALSLPLLTAFLLLLPYLLYRSWLARFQAVADAARAGVSSPASAGRAGEAVAEGGASWAGADALAASGKRWPGPALLLLLAAASWLRLGHLGYAEFQGDEARALLMAERLTAADDASILLRHKKGPLEVLLPAAALGRGDPSERSARLPFALASLAALAGLFALARRLWGPRAALFTLGLAALDGYLLAFGRIVQYQSLVLLYGITAVACAWRWSRRGRGAAGVQAGRGRGDGELLLAALLLAFGCWAHYEAILALPPLALLAWERARREADGWPGALRRLLGPTLAGALLLAAFYLPFVVHPQFAETWRYIAGRRLGGSPPYNLLGDYFLRASFYNASYYVLVISAVGLLALAWRLRALLGGGRRGAWSAGIWLAALALLFLRPAWFQLGPAPEEGPARSLAVLLFAPVLAYLVLARRGTGEAPADAAWRLQVLWLSFPLLAAGFLVKKPHTHFYTLLPAWLLTVGWALDAAGGALTARLPGAGGRRLAGVLVWAAILALLGHQHWVFVNHRPEYKRVYPEARLPGVWMPFGDQPPRGGYFGFPYRAGWSVVRDLYAMGLLQGSYDSNEEPLITGWYSRGAPRCPAPQDPDWVFVAWRPQDEEDLPLDAIRAERRLWATVTVEGQVKLEIFARPAPASAPAARPLALDADLPPRALAAAVLGDDEAAIKSALSRLSGARRQSFPVGRALELALAGEAGGACR